MNTLLWWMVQTSGVVLVLIVIVTLASFALKNRPAWRHALWLVVLVKFVTPPIVSWPWSLHEVADRLQAVKPAEEAASRTADQWYPLDAAIADRDPAGLFIVPDTAEQPVALPFHQQDWSVASAPVSEVQMDNEEVAMDRAHEFPAIAAAVTGPLVRWMFFGVWGTGCLFASLIQIRRLWRQRAVVTGGMDAPPSLQEEIQITARRLNVRAIPIRVARGVMSPFLWCVGRLRLVWPNTLTAGDEVRRSRGILAHELAHVRRRDHWVAWIELIAGILWWWHPLFWLVRRRLRESAEMACDAIALSVYDDRREYARLFLELSSSFKTGAPAPVLGVSTGTPSSFERRLSMILNDRVSGKLSLWGCLIVGCMATCALPNWLLAQSPTDDETRPQVSEVAEEIPDVSNLSSRDGVPILHTFPVVARFYSIDASDPEETAPGTEFQDLDEETAPGTEFQDFDVETAEESDVKALQEQIQELRQALLLANKHRDRLAENLEAALRQLPAGRDRSAASSNEESTGSTPGRRVTIDVVDAVEHQLITVPIRIPGKTQGHDVQLRVKNQHTDAFDEEAQKKSYKVDGMVTNRSSSRFGSGRPGLPALQVSPHEDERELQQQLLELDVAEAEAARDSAKRVVDRMLAVQKEGGGVFPASEVDAAKSELERQEIQFKRAVTVLQLFKLQARRKQESAPRPGTGGTEANRR